MVALLVALQFYWYFPWLLNWSLFSCFISVIADVDLMKSVLETSRLLTSPYKAEHPSNTEDGLEVGLSSEDEAEGLPADPGRPCRGIVTGPAPAPESTGDNEVVVKKRALRRVKQQVSTLLRGEDLPEGAQAREVAEVPYQLPPVSRDAKECPICQQVFKTHHRLMHHMGVHRGKNFPCEIYGKILASRKMLKVHVAACVQGKRVSCSDCDWSFSSRQGMRQHFRVKHGAEAPERDESFLCPYSAKVFAVRKSMREHCGVCTENPDRKGPFYCRVLGCPSAEHAFSQIKSLNAHLSGVHGWAECQA